MGRTYSPTGDLEATGGTLIDIKTILAAGAEQAPIKAYSGYTPLIIVPPGYKTEPLTHEVPAPLLPFIKQRVTFNDLDSFASYVKRYQTSSTIIVVKATPSGAEFVAIFDYHLSKSDNDTATQANRLAHVAKYPCPPSFEWQQWFGKNGVGMKQEEFAHFIELNTPDIVNPDSATLLEMALNFEAKSTVDFKSKINHQNGARVLEFNEIIEGTGNTKEGSIKVPESIELSLPVFHGGKKFNISAKLYYRPNGGKLTIAYELRRPHELVETAVKDIKEDITQATGITPLLGAVEGI